jgi:hypothetical protein
VKQQHADWIIETLLVFAVAALLASLLWTRPPRKDAPPKLQVSWAWEGCYVKALGHAPWAGAWSEEDLVCVV